MKRYTSIIFISATTFLVLTGTNFFLSEWCPAIDAFNGGSISNFFSAFKRLAITFILWLIGVRIFMKWQVAQRINRVLYFVILTMAVSYPITKSFFSNIMRQDSEIMSSICSKSTDNGMVCKMHELTLHEYEFIRQPENWLPRVPKMSEHISIDYYRDNFIGDFSLTIELQIQEKEPLDSLEYPDWLLIDSENINTRTYRYFEVES